MKNIDHADMSFSKIKSNKGESESYKINSNSRFKIYFAVENRHPL